MHLYTVNAIILKPNTAQYIEKNEHTTVHRISNKIVRQSKENKNKNKKNEKTRQSISNIYKT